MSDINKRIKIVREHLYGERGKSKLCKDLKVSETTYQGYELKTDIPCSFIKKICEIKGISAEWIFFNKGAMIKPIQKPDKERTKVKRRIFDRRRGNNMSALFAIVNHLEDSELIKIVASCSKKLENKLYEFLRQEKEVEGE